MADTMFELGYGAGAQALALPVGVAHTVLHPTPRAAIAPARLADALIQAVTTCESAPPLSALAARAKSVCVVVSDKTRNYGQALLLPILLDHLNEAGVPDTCISVLIGNGAHENHSHEEKLTLLGHETLSRVQVADHDADDPHAVTLVGTTPAGTPVKLNRRLLDADLKIVTGGVTHHYYAGFSGGRKGIMPGCAARETIEANHSLAITPGGAPHPRAAIGVLGGNPVHEDMLAAARMVDNVFLINAVTSTDGAPAMLCAGNMEAAHTDAAGVARACYEVAIEKQSDLVIASCGGAPRDISFYQAHKSYNNAFAACKPGGTLLLLAQCPAGPGPEGFTDWFALGSVDAIAKRLQKKYSVPGQTAMATLRKSNAVRTVLVSDLNDDQALLMNMEPARSAEHAMSLIGNDFKNICIIPQAAYTVPILS